MVTALVIVRHEEPALLETLAALVPAVADGVVRDAVLVSPHDSDGLRTVADASGCSLVTAPGDDLLVRGAAAARAPWLFVLAAGMVPGGLWIDDLADAVAMEQPSVFTLHPRPGLGQAVRAAGLNFRARWLGQAHPDLGLVLPRDAVARPPRVKRLPSPLHDRRGLRRGAGFSG